MYKVFLEKRAEREIKKLPAEIFYRIIPKLKTLSENPKPPGAVKSQEPKVTGASGLETIASFLRLMNRKRL